MRDILLTNATRGIRYRPVLPKRYLIDQRYPRDTSDKKCTIEAQGPWRQFGSLHKTGLLCNGVVRRSGNECCANMRKPIDEIKSFPTRYHTPQIAQYAVSNPMSKVGNFQSYNTQNAQN